MDHPPICPCSTCFSSASLPSQHPTHRTRRTSGITFLSPHDQNPTDHIHELRPEPRSPTPYPPTPLALHPSPPPNDDIPILNLDDPHGYTNVDDSVINDSYLDLDNVHGYTHVADTAVDESSMDMDNVHGHVSSFSTEIDEISLRSDSVHGYTDVADFTLDEAGLDLDNGDGYIEASAHTTITTTAIGPGPIQELLRSTSVPQSAIESSPHDTVEDPRTTVHLLNTRRHRLPARNFGPLTSRAFYNALPAFLQTLARPPPTPHLNTSDHHHPAQATPGAPEPPPSYAAALQQEATEPPGYDAPPSYQCWRCQSEHMTMSVLPNGEFWGRCVDCWAHIPWGTWRMWRSYSRR